MSFINNNEFNHRDYNLLIQQVSSSPPSGPVVITPIAETVSAIATIGTPVFLAIDATRSIVFYQRAVTFTCAAVVVDISGAAPVFGTPVTVDLSIPRIPFSIRAVPGSATQFICFYRAINAIYACVIEVSGLTITTPYAIATTAVGFILSRGYGEMLSANSGGFVFEANSLVACAPIDVTGGAVTFGPIAYSALVKMGGGGSRPLIDSGQLIQFGYNSTAAPFYIGAVAFNISGLVASPTSVYMPPVVADRIQANATYGQGSTIDAGGGVVAFLYQDFSTGSVASTRGAWSGTAASYSNSDASPNILPALPYAPPPASEIQNYGQVSFSSSIGVYSINTGDISLYPVGIAGTVNMAGDITLVGSGANANRCELDFNDATTISYCYAKNISALLTVGVAAIS